MFLSILRIKSSTGQESSPCLLLFLSHQIVCIDGIGGRATSTVAGVVDGKVYIFGGCDDRNSSKWGEVFDPKKQTWDALPMPPPYYSLPTMCESIAIEDEKVVSMNGALTCISYIPSESKWKIGNQETSELNRCWHLIENVVYCCELGGRILWREAHEWEEWREVMGLESLRETLAASKLVNYAGRLGDLSGVQQTADASAGIRDNRTR
ncbi:unnamed protein product [Brassica rapa]|uniref:FKB95-like N-terminal Kelch domain-containing protein n=1 Tax=Brassica campestris TaxID=3711 RepID=A0A8D9MEF3_BRACM|nr:unnamed protein product [Brassica rapa]